jgi:hypothetical protein
MIKKSLVLDTTNSAWHPAIRIVVLSLVTVVSVVQYFSSLSSFYQDYLSVLTVSAMIKKSHVLDTTNGAWHPA